MDDRNICLGIVGLGLMGKEFASSVARWCQSFIPSITGGIFEFGFSDAFQQMIAAFCMEFSSNGSRHQFHNVTPQVTCHSVKITGKDAKYSLTAAPLIKKGLSHNLFPVSSKRMVLTFSSPHLCKKGLTGFLSMYMMGMVSF